MNRINIGKLLVLVIIFLITSNCSPMIQMYPKGGWREANEPKATLENLQGWQPGTPHAPMEIKSFAIGKHGVWVTTNDGRVFRTFNGKWQDVSAIFPKDVIGAIQTQPRFKFVASRAYTGDILAIDDNGKIYLWLEQ